MPSAPAQSDDMSHDAERAGAHPSAVAPTSSADPKLKLRPAVQTSVPLDPAARRARKVYNGLSASSVGLELGVSVIIGLLAGYFLDQRLGSGPWLMLLFLGFGFAAGFRGVLRAVARAERAAAAEASEAANG